MGGAFFQNKTEKTGSHYRVAPDKADEIPFRRIPLLCPFRRFAMRIDGAACNRANRQAYQYGFQKLREQSFFLCRSD